ncbi:hypothetical protein NEUTE2DRAFT_51541 [Neurospora tetrasperma FGSC 2509]|nr:hypothetical protein NEUTE2DRAFT_51541 [Neurospora tetrasperma FGSC 2509]
MSSTSSTRKVKLYKCALADCRSWPIPEVQRPRSPAKRFTIPPVHGARVLYHTALSMRFGDEDPLRLDGGADNQSNRRRHLAGREHLFAVRNLRGGL